MIDVISLYYFVEEKDIGQGSKYVVMALDREASLMHEIRR
jgi:hypothetical protein